MQIIDRLFGIQTKNLYLGVLRIHTESWAGWGKVRHSYQLIEPPQFVWVRKNKNDFFESYTDVFSKTTYKGPNVSLDENEVVVDIIRCVAPEKRRIPYKDAQKTLAKFNKR